MRRNFSCIFYCNNVLNRNIRRIATLLQCQLTGQPVIRNVLNKGETLSSFVEQALRDQIRRRRLQKEFIARGLASRDKARQSGEYYGAGEVIAELDSILSKAEKK